MKKNLVMLAVLGISFSFASHSYTPEEEKFFYREEGPITVESIDYVRVQVMKMSDHSILIKMRGHYYEFQMEHFEGCEGCEE